MAWLQEIAVRIRSQNRSDLLRVGILFPDNKAMRTEARLFSALKMLDHVVSQHATKLNAPPKLAELTDIADYRMIFDEVIFSEWRFDEDSLPRLHAKL